METKTSWTKPRTVFAFMFYLTACYMLLREMAIPQFLNTVCSTLLGYYFGQRSSKNENKTV